MTLTILLQTEMWKSVFITSHENLTFTWVNYDPAANIEEQEHLSITIGVQPSIELDWNTTYDETAFLELNDALFTECLQNGKAGTCKDSDGFLVYFHKMQYNKITGNYTVNVGADGLTFQNGSNIFKRSMKLELYYMFDISTDGEASFSCSDLDVDIQEECPKLMKNIGKSESRSIRLIEWVPQNFWGIDAEVVNSNITATIKLLDDFPADPTGGFTKMEIFGICLIVIVVLMIILLPISCIKSNKRSAPQNRPISQGFGQNRTWTKLMRKVRPLAGLVE